MLLGHWQEMKALGQAQDAVAALAELLPDDAERVGPDGAIEAVTIDSLQKGDVVLVRSGARVPADGEIVDRSEEHTSELQSLMRISYAVFCLKKKKHTQLKYTLARESP